MIYLVIVDPECPIREQEALQRRAIVAVEAGCIRPAASSFALELHVNRARKTKEALLSTTTKVDLLSTAEFLRIRRFRPGYVTRLKLYVGRGILGRRRRDRGDGGHAEPRSLVV